MIITEYDPVAVGLVERLRAAGIPYFIVEPDAAKAARFVGEDLSVVAGENDSRATYERLLTPAARLVVANCEDTVNTNITLTVREVAPQVHIAAVVEEDDSVDILQLSGATTVLPLKRQLGESLANRVDTGRAEAHVIGSFRERADRGAAGPRHAPGGRAACATRACASGPASASSASGSAASCSPRFPHTEIRADSVVVVAGTAAQIARAQRAARARRHDGAGAGDWRREGRTGRRAGAEAEGAGRLRARSR